MLKVYLKDLNRFVRFLSRSDTQYQKFRTCKILKEIRRQIAEANDIEYVVEECQYKGDCLGTCPKCEAEVRYLEEQLHQRQLLGKAAMVAGISVGMFTLSSCDTKGTRQGDVPQVQKVESLKDEDIEKIEAVVGQVEDVQTECSNPSK